MKCIMMCAGEYNRQSEQKLLHLALRENCFVIAVDGGLRYLREEEIEPELVLGDFDSLAGEDRLWLDELEAAAPDHVIRLPVRKDETDTLAAAGIGLDRGCTEFLIFGAMGGRLDHTWANIQTLLWLRRRGAHAWLIGDHTYLTVIESEEWKVPAQFDGTVSLFALDSALEGVTIKNMKYEVDDASLTNDYPIGTSNETLPDAPRGWIRIRKGAALVILTDYLHNKYSKC